VIVLLPLYLKILFEVNYVLVYDTASNSYLDIEKRYMMNDRIRELADKAKEYAEWSTPQGLEWFDNFKEQFAELIVLQCASICESIGEQAEIIEKGEMARKTKATAKSCAKIIKLSFGVE